MSENKRYYWLKLKEDFFEDDTIQWLEEQENGTEYTLFYLKLCLKSLKTEGSMMRYVGERMMPYDKKALAKITNTDIDTVVVAMELFKSIGLIDVYETGEIFLKQISEMTGSETSKAELMRRKRARDSMSNNVTALLPDVTETLPRVRDRERDKEIEKELQQEEKTSSGSGIDVHLFYQQNFGTEPPTIVQDIDYWVNDLSEEVVIAALKKTAEAEKPYSYAKGIMKKWLSKGIKTIEQVEAESVSNNRRNGNARKEPESYGGIVY